ncbi:anaerobic glycerol-3-phosphate dehydrogenase subunit GlpB [Azotosporobacter soli]|uniref:anaerobic glycerol-3-phosphate dehydrogenase subunit GlpB n=1 Tax=Azotosporobacter soli TaxID=3055040 RepID=UPI0031FF4444
MKENDVIVIGGGFSGLMAAAVAAKRGKKVTVLSLGAGTLSIASGNVDVLGYDKNGKPVANPKAGLSSVAADHPYNKIGQKSLEEAVQFFLELTKEEGYAYKGSLDQQQWIPTAAGTLKPTCLVPMTMDTSALKNASKAYIIGFESLKDFYPHLVAKNLRNMPGYDQEYEMLMVDPKLPAGRDVTNLDIARWLDSAEGRKAFVAQLRATIKPGSVAVIAPVLGTAPSHAVRDELEQALNCKFVESVVVPPGITGHRLRIMMLNHVKKLGVKVVEHAVVTRGIVENGQCTAVVTEAIDRERTYQAKSFILASGGFYGGGLVAEPGQAIEPVFNLPIAAPTTQEDWSNFQMFSNEAQPFEKIGIAVDETMRPVDADGKVLLNNVFIAGRNLCGYDFCFEKSGNGVAMASGYKAAMSV